MRSVGAVQAPKGPSANVPNPADTTSIGNSLANVGGFALHLGEVDVQLSPELVILLDLKDVKEKK